VTRMGTRLLRLDAKWVLAVPAVLMGCNAVLDNPVGDLDSAGGSISVGGHTGTAGGVSAIGGHTGTLAASAVGGSAALGGDTSVGGTPSGMGSSQPAGGATSTSVNGLTGGDSTSGGAMSIGGNSANGGNLNLGGDGAGGVGATGGSNPIVGGNTATSANATGGADAIGGALGSGGVNASGGTTAMLSTAGSGGAAMMGGAPASSGAAIGGVNASGGSQTGGTLTMGGAATGGAPAVGGDSSTGGLLATGGAATGGASSIVGPSVIFSYSTVNDAATTNMTTATFGFSSVPASSSTTFMCNVNGAVTFTDCTSSISLSGLASGGQTVVVHALDSGGHVGPDATRSWTVAPLSTTIKSIRANAASYDDYLVSVSTGVRVTGFGTESSKQVIFVQEAGPATVFRVDALTDIAGNTVLNSGILTRALTSQAIKAEGTPVTVIGAVTHNGSSQELVRATYIWGTGAAIPYLAPQVRTSTVFTAGLEGVHIELDGQIPSYNCSSGCNNGALGNSSKCIETVCMDSTCTTNKILSWLDITGGASLPVTAGYGAWMGWLVKRSSYYELWTNSSVSVGNDICM